MKRIIPCIVLFSIYIFPLQAQSLYGVTFRGGSDDGGSINKYIVNTNDLTIENSFQRTGANPYYTNLVEAADGKLYGMTFNGGGNAGGVIFSYNPASKVYIKLYDFDPANGSKPTGSLILGSNGKLYGMTSFGGTNNAGVIFSFNPADSNYVKLYDFDNTTGGHPSGSLVLASDGKMYGLAAEGGAGNAGIIFSFDPAATKFSKLVDFDNTNGGSPLGDLIQASNGLLYGMSTNGGSNGAGVIFSYNISSSSYNKIRDFDSAGGYYPYGSFIQATNNKLYAMTFKGGSNNGGVIFSFDISSSTYTKLHDLDSANGSDPYGSLVQASNGKLYGLTSAGGSSNLGVLFSYDITSGYQKIKDLIYTEGGAPFGSLAKAADGKLYGMTFQGGSSNTGVVFSFDPVADTYMALHDFSTNFKGRGPSGSLIVAADKKLYGTTVFGGSNNDGVIFSFDPSSSKYSILFSFDSSDGANSYGSLLQAADGKLYGLSNAGGSYNAGTLFSFDINTITFTKLKDFDTASGSNPYGSLIQAANGKLYGMTSYGGNKHSGTIFSYDIFSNTYTKLKDFTNTDGANPYGSLLQMPDGKMYGITYGGGDGVVVRGDTTGAGVLFSFDPSNAAYNKIRDFDYMNDGGFPYGSLTKALDGKLYGMTYEGGSNDFGVVFSFDPSSTTFTKLANFDYVNNGANPYGNLLQSTDGNLYGMAYTGGSSGFGEIFSFNTSTSTLTPLKSFDSDNGANPYIGSGFIELNDSGPLPVTLLSFTGKNNGSENILSWKVNNEQQLDFYELEKSFDGQYFSPVAHIPATRSNTYSYADKFIIAGNIYFYRLKSIDQDGLFTYSNIIKLDAAGGNNFVVVYPNPFAGNLVISVQSAIEDNASIIIYDLNGRQLYRQLRKVSPGTNVIGIDETSRLAKGTYLLTVVTSQQNKTIKIIKAN